jgi:hypothetical protein
MLESAEAPSRTAKKRKEEEDVASMPGACSPSELADTGVEVFR